MAQQGVVENYNVNSTLSVTGISFYIFGLGSGPLFLGPISEYYGRRVVYICGLIFFLAMQLPTAFAHNIEGIIIPRFFAGFGGSAFMVVANGTIFDLFHKEKIAKPTQLYGLFPLAGPGVGPFVGGFLTEHLGYKWDFYFFLIYTGVMLLLVVIFVPETYEPLLLARKAQRIRKTTRNSNYYAPLERLPTGLAENIFLSSKRPFLILFQDPMHTCLCLYSGLILAVVYMFFIVFPMVFSEVYGFDYQGQGLAFLGITMGFLLITTTMPFFKKSYDKRVAGNNGVAEPEIRLPLAILGSLLVPIGLFWFGWSARKDVQFMVCIIGSAVFGLGVSYSFAGIITFTVDTYAIYSASALAGNSFVRSTMASAFPLFGGHMFTKLGTAWATSLLAFVSLAFVPLTISFFIYGLQIRTRSKFAFK